MSDTFTPAQRVSHAEHGEGVIVDVERNGYVRAFFPGGERLVAVTARVLICTAAGREGINLQFARILFNFDLPWNPMDMEQRLVDGAGALISNDYQVEHVEPKSGALGRVLDWRNLALACGGGTYRHHQDPSRAYRTDREISAGCRLRPATKLTSMKQEASIVNEK